jgi:hypothetical protein
MQIFMRRRVAEQRAQSRAVARGAVRSLAEGRRGGASITRGASRRLKAPRNGTCPTDCPCVARRGFFFATSEDLQNIFALVERGH